MMNDKSKTNQTNSQKGDKNMAENNTNNEVKVVEKKDGVFKKFGKWCYKHREAIITGFTVAGIVGTGAYIVGSAVHYKPTEKTEKIDGVIENLCTAENSEMMSDSIPTPELESAEVEAIQNPEV